MSHFVESQQAVFGVRASLSSAIIKVFIAIITVLFISAAPASAAVPRAYAGIVVDAKTGNTLYSYAADSARYPASVTKVMTLYILFQELEAGRLNLSTPMTVSRHATQAVPTKLNLRAGRTIKVEDAIKALVTLSANDVARVIAEHISGTESAFARRMTSTARAMGMSRTTYANASGLPDSRQITTVRDQARLGMAVFQHFPRYYEYFQIRSFTYAGRTYGNHNRLLGESGVDGIKTGYTRASGYNLLTAARKNNRHIIVVGFGFSSGAARNAKVRELIGRYFNRARRGSYWQQASIPTVSAQGTQNVFAVAQATPVTPAPRPAWRDNNMPPALETAPAQIQVAAHDPNSSPIELVQPAPLLTMRAEQLAATTAVASIEPPTQLIPLPALQSQTLQSQALQSPAITASIAAPPPLVQPHPIDVIGAWLSDNFSLGSQQTGQLQNSGVEQLLPPAPIGNSPVQAIDLMTSGSIGQAANQNSASAPSVSAWVVQIGAPPSAEAAHNMLNVANNNIAGLREFRPYVERFEKTGQTFFRARFTGFAERAHAVSMCEQIKQNNMSCLAVQS